MCICTANKHRLCSVAFIVPWTWTVHAVIINNHQFDDDMRRVAYYKAAPYGPLQCGKLCALEGRCVVINYHVESRTCELVETSAGFVSDSAGWVSTADITFVNGQLGSCANGDQHELDVCVPLRNGGHTSMKKYCPVPPTLSHSNATSDTRNVGDMVTYTCNEGFYSVGVLNVTCLANGQWSPLNNTQCIPWVQDDIKLVNGSNQYEGRVEIYRDGIWGMVCDSNWDDTDAEVVCRQLGYSGGQHTRQTYFGSRPGIFWMYQVICDGTETRLADCPFSIHDWYHTHNAGVICSGN